MSAAGEPARIVAAKGLPDAADVRNQIAFDDLAAAQVEALRKTAESWRTGLAALFTVVGGLALVSGRSAIDQYTPTGRWVIVLLALVTLISTLVAGWFALRAAYGSPQRLSRNAFDLDLWRDRQAQQSALNLKRAQYLSIVALGFLLTGVAAVWLAPQPRPSPPALVSLALTNARNVCGELLSYDHQSLTVEPPGEPPVTVGQSEVTGMILVESCAS